MTLNLIPILILSGLSGLSVWIFQDARHGAAMSQYRAEVLAEKAAASERLRKVEGDFNAKYQAAVNASRDRERALRASRDSARNVAEGLQRKLDSADQRLAAASREAAIEYGLALSKVFGQCKDRYRELGARADGHASDVATCHAAWPAFGPDPAASQVIQP